MNQRVKITTFHTVTSNTTAQYMMAAILASQSNPRVAVIESSLNANIAFCFDEIEKKTKQNKTKKQLVAVNLLYFETAPKLIALVVWWHRNHGMTNLYFAYFTDFTLKKVWIQEWHTSLESDHPDD